jgi:hypothetical protein
MIFYNFMYGVWAIQNFYTFFVMSDNCKHLSNSLSFYNYEVALLLGCFPAANTVFGTLIALILIPLGLYQSFTSYKDRYNQIKRVKDLMKSLVSKEYDQQVF